MTEVPDSTQTLVEEELHLFTPESIGDLMHKVTSGIVQLAINIFLAIVVFYAGRFLIRKLTSFVAKILVRRDVDLSLSTFILSLVRIVLYFILIVTIIGILGLETSSFLALFASAGVAVGMALSGTLQNFAGGVLILLLKPYKIGDYIEAQGYAGTVKEIQIFSTVITTYDNKIIIIPNGPLSTGSINNWSREGYRRVHWNISVSYGDNIQQAREAIMEMFAKDDRIVKGMIEDDREQRESQNRQKGAAATVPAEFLDKMPKKNGQPTVVVESLADSAVVMQVRAWIQTDDYWDVYFYYNELFYNELPKHGVHFPFPQLDVHLDQKINGEDSPAEKSV